MDRAQQDTEEMEVSIREPERKRIRTTGDRFVSSIIGDSEMKDWLLIEILIRLPAKSVFIYKSVSKRWFSLISHPSFHKLFLSRPSLPPPSWTLLYCYQKLPILTPAINVAIKDHPPEFDSPNFQLGFLRTTSYIRILSTSNGLFLCAHEIENWHNLYYICNPLTGQWVALPKPLQLGRRVSATLFVDKPYSGSASFSYKVIRMKEVYDSKLLELETFSSETGEWKDTTVLSPLPPVTELRIDFYKSMVHHNGFLHCLTGDHNIIAYDPNLEDGADYTCRHIGMPGDHLVEERERELLASSHGHLRYAVVKRQMEGAVASWFLRVWVLVDYDTEDWFLQHDVELGDILFSDPDGFAIPHVAPLAFHPLDDDILYVSCWRKVLKTPMIASYSLRKRTLESECYNSSGGQLCSSRVFPFVLPPWPTPVPSPTWAPEA